MNEFYSSADDVATSCKSETYFKIMKNEYLFNTAESGQKFILRDLDCIEGDIKLGRSEIKTLLHNAKNQSQSKNILTDKDSCSKKNINKADLTQNSNLQLHHKI